MIRFQILFLNLKGDPPTLFPSFLHSPLSSFPPSLSPPPFLCPSLPSSFPPSLPFSGVSCDACGKGGFSGKRYKCLVCYDFDLCADCYEAGETGTGRHSTLHPMQCILTRVDAGRSAVVVLLANHCLHISFAHSDTVGCMLTLHKQQN